MDNQIETTNLMATNYIHTYIEKFRINKSDPINKDIKPSHTSMGSYLGSFNVPDVNTSQFFKNYQKTLKSNIIPSILESHLDQGPIIIDLDFKYTLNSTAEPRIYTNTEIEAIINIYNQVLLTYLSINEDDFNIYILEKSKPKIINRDDNNHKISYKDGIHIIYPFICANNKVQFFFRELVINKIIEDKILDHLNIDNTIEDVFDKAVIERNNWLLYGSCKDGKKESLYTLTKIYDYNMKLMDLDDVDWNNLPSLLSIRKFKFQEDQNEYVPGVTYDSIINLYNELLGSKTGNKPYAINSDIRKAKLLIEMLSPVRARNYSTWIEVGFCLHNIDESLLESWIEFSQKAPNFKVGECEKLWNKFKYEGLSIGSLHRWAKEDNHALYSDFLFNELDDILKNSLDNTSYAIAKVFYEFNKYNYVCTSIKNKKWFEFKDHRWVHMDEANNIIKKLNTELSNDYIKLGIALGQKALFIESEEAKRKMIEKSKIAYSIAQKLHKMSFKREVISELLHLYYDPQFMLQLDENRYLIGFNNGVYDLKAGYFRNGRPEDYISMSTNNDYIEYNPDNVVFKEVADFFEQIQPDKEMREYLLVKLSSFLEGIQRDQKFEIWTGTGANGKGRILKLLLDAFGDYGTTIPITLLTKPRGDSNQASPALANTKGKRCCVFQEPENDDKIYVGHMKNITGGDKLMARSLFSDPTEFYPQFKTILACNKLPDIPSADGGTWRRIRVVPFETTFVDDPIQPHERKKIKNIDDLIENWKSAFMSILLVKYKHYIQHGIDEPNKVLIQTHQYQNNSDIFMEFIGEKIISTDNREYVTLEDLWKEFRHWYKESGKQDKKITRTDLRADMEIKLGESYKNKYIGYRFKTEHDNDDDNNVTEKLNSSYNPGHEITESNMKLKKSISPLSKSNSKPKNKIDANMDLFDDEGSDCVFIANQKVITV